jgi:RNA polymerase sigma-70 factor (ECF subfamily)
MTIDVAPSEWMAAVADPSDGTDLWSVVSSLAPDRRAAFVLTQVVGCDYAEAAQICGCPVGTIRSRVARARADLIDALRETPASTSRSGIRQT